MTLDAIPPAPEASSPVSLGLLNAMGAGASGRVLPVVYILQPMASSHERVSLIWLVTFRMSPSLQAPSV